MSELARLAKQRNWSKYRLMGVTFPREGLTAIVLTAITDLGSFELFLTAVVLAGCIQLVLGFIKAGTISNYFPNNVIGKMTGIS